MSAHILLLSSMRTVLNRVGIPEVSASGEFSLPSNGTTLFPGAVYGFAARLTVDERLALFEESRSRGLCRLTEASVFKAIEEDLYPIYWGMDKQLGARPYQHLGNPTGTGAIRLSTYEILKGKTVACATLVVADYVQAELAMKLAFPDLLKTSTKKYGEDL